jgi:hypothetical protein
MARRIPQPLYDEVFELVTLIAQPYAEPLEDDDQASAALALGKLRDLYEKQRSAGAPDPLLTEALADFTDDDAESIRLYRLALAQAADFPGEPTHTKRVGLARRLCQLGLASDAKRELEVARREAFAVHDSNALEELDELAKELAV